MTDDWYQTHLIPPSVVEVRARLGAVPETEHGQWLVELHDPVEKTLVGQRSCPHFPLDQLEDQLVLMVEAMRALVVETSSPF